MLFRFIVKILGSTLGIALAAKFVGGAAFTGSAESLFLAGLILGSLTTFLEPILKIIAFPLLLLTLNLFSLVIDMAMLWLTQALVPGFDIEGLLALFIATILILLINKILWTILSPLLR